MGRRALSSVAAGLAAIAIPATATAAIVAPRVPVTVRPTSVGPRTNVSLSFRQPSPTGLLPDARIIETMGTIGPAGRDCASTTSTSLPAAPAGALIRRTLRPATLHGGRWCLGTYHGVIELSQFPRCTTGPIPRACPMYVIAPRAIASFSFRVTRPPA